MKNKDLRMYVLVPYNLSPIQQGIQAAHAIAEYSRLDPADEKGICALYEEWVDDHKTIIILNGGTTGFGGSMQQYHMCLMKMGVETAKFNEPDLNNATTAIAFIVDMKEDSHIVGYLRQLKLA